MNNSQLSRIKKICREAFKKKFTKVKYFSSTFFKTPVKITIISLFPKDDIPSCTLSEAQDLAKEILRNTESPLALKIEVVDFPKTVQVKICELFSSHKLPEITISSSSYRVMTRKYIFYTSIYEDVVSSHLEKFLLSFGKNLLNLNFKDNCEIIIPIPNKDIKLKIRSFEQSLKENDIFPLEIKVRPIKFSYLDLWESDKTFFIAYEICTNPFVIKKSPKTISSNPKNFENLEKIRDAFKPFVPFWQILLSLYSSDDYDKLTYTFDIDPELFINNTLANFFYDIVYSLRENKKLISVRDDLLSIIKKFIVLERIKV